MSSYRHNIGPATYLEHGQIPPSLPDTVPLCHNRALYRVLVEEELVGVRHEAISSPNIHLSVVYMRWLASSDYSIYSKNSYTNELTTAS